MVSRKVDELRGEDQPFPSSSLVVIAFMLRFEQPLMSPLPGKQHQNGTTRLHTANPVEANQAYYQYSSNSSGQHEN